MDATRSLSTSLVMILSTIVFLALFQVGHAAFDGERFSGDYELLVEYKVHTADKTFAGTNSNLSFSFGYLGDSTDKLVYHQEGVAPKLGRTNFEQDQIDTFSDVLSGANYKKVEAACAKQSTKEAEYKNCLTRPNIVFIDAQSKKLFGIADDWMLDSISVKVTVRSTSTKEAKATGSSQFLAQDKWIKPKRKYYLRSTEEGAPTLINKGVPVDGRAYP
ncbi:hypothetical protein QR680_007652 [Steinernema hermaphroditum]|uniref:Vitellogenin domain-containing protein n=1 Tax=Steinernema hermaphroditum TaxID=289476 RepID=A0AA39M6R6_9BILA|nr:hypothetical protein QR680_007652 [Steinernema hermaphroditum]